MGGAQTGSRGRRLAAVGVAWTLAVAAAFPAEARAQHEDHPSPAPPPALDQIEQVRDAVGHLSTPEAARRAGYRLAFPWIPTMGEHWTRRDLLRSGELDLERPPVLMFSDVEGEPTLIGVAYGFFGPPDAPLPEGFEGDADRWHDHDRLAPPGQTLHMLHAWLVPSPDGPFAGHNPWVAYWAAGLPTPGSAFAEGEGSAERVRALGVALGLAVDVGAALRSEGAGAAAGRRLARFVEPNPALLAIREEAGAAIEALIPELRTALETQDDDELVTLADEAIGWLDAWETALLDAVPVPRLREELRLRLAEQRRGGHGHP